MNANIAGVETGRCDIERELFSTAHTHAHTRNESPVVRPPVLSPGYRRSPACGGVRRIWDGLGPAVLVVNNASVSDDAMTSQSERRRCSAAAVAADVGDEATSTYNKRTPLARAAQIG